jgi:hypothetical protein
MRLIIVKEVFSDRPVDPNRYRSFLDELAAFFKDHFRVRIAEELRDLKIHIRKDDVANIAFLSQAMISKAIDLGNMFPALKIVVFSSLPQESAVRGAHKNVFLIKKGEDHFGKALKVFHHG